MSTPQSEDELKTKECDERQEEMDAIAGFGTRCEFPPVSGAFAQPSSTGVDRDQDPTVGRVPSPSP